MQNLFLAPQVEEVHLNKQGAAGFASAFVQSYFKYSKEEGFEPVAAYTILRDNRRATERILKQEVVVAETIEVEQLQGSYFKVQVLLNLKTRHITGEEHREKEEMTNQHYIATVWLSEGVDGFRITHYPALQPVNRFVGSEPPYPKKAEDSVGENMRPMLISFFRTYFNGEDVANFMAAGAEKPSDMKNTFDFISLENLEIYGENRPWLVYATVRIQDSTTKIQFNMTYEFFMVFENQKFAIQSINI